MKSIENRRPGVDRIGAIKRKAVSLSSEGLIKAGSLHPGQLPLVIEPTIEGVNLIAWAQSHREFIQSQLLAHGGILFRNFTVKSVAQFEAFILATSDGELLEYSYASTPRRLVSGRIYTSTEYPADQTIPWHNEMAYARHWPMKIYFLCVEPAARGGETPLADSRKIFQRLPEDIRDAFARKKVLYVRNYGGGLDLPWQRVFHTTDRSLVEDSCRRAGIEFEWRAGDRLRTRQICQAVAAHPKTGHMVWFNQAHLFHVSSLEPAVRESVLATIPEADLPRHAYHGDGSPIDPSALDEVRRIYHQEAIAFPWRRGDILMLDNMLTAHGRAPFIGPRSVLVGMAESFGSQDI